MHSYFYVMATLKILINNKINLKAIAIVDSDLSFLIVLILSFL